MTGVGQTPRTLEEFVQFSSKRTTSLERSLYSVRATSLGAYLGVGPGLAIDGQGTLEEPFTISLATTEVVDWDDATEVGAYWGAAGSLNAPFSSDAFVGDTWAMGDLVLQELRLIATGGLGVGIWKRIYDGISWSTYRQKTPFTNATTVTGSGTYQASVAVTFPVNYFPSPPIVTVGAATSGSTTGVLVGSALSVTTSGFTLRVQTAQGTNFSSAFDIPWIAAQ